MAKRAFTRSGLDRVREVLARDVERSDVPGLVALVQRHGETHVETAGVTSVGGDTPMRRDMICRIASMTKPITAVATLMLVEECRLRLDEPVDRFLPELVDRQVVRSLEGPVDDTVPAHRPITVRDLLTFTPGIGTVMAIPGTYAVVDALNEVIGFGPPQPSLVPEPDEWMRRLGRLPILHQPGEQWLYNAGSDILGVLVARASGQTFPDFLRERIFEPLEMTDTGFSVPPDKTDRFVTAYSNDMATGEFGVHDEPVGGQWNSDPAFPSGAGGLVSTVDDFNTFAQMLLRGGVHGDERVVSRPSVTLMTSDQLTPEQKAHGALSPGFFDNHGWGFGVEVVTRRDTIYDTVGRYGWAGGLGTTWNNDPVEDMTTILLTQRAFGSPEPPVVHDDFWTTAYAAIDD